MFRAGKQKSLYIWAQTLRSLSIFLRNYGNIKIFVWGEHCKCVSGGVEQEEKKTNNIRQSRKFKWTPRKQNLFNAGNIAI